MLLAEAYFHTLDPFAIQFPSSWVKLPFVPEGIRWYGLSYAMGFLIAWWMLRTMARTGRAALSVEAVGDLMFAVIIGVLIGGRLGYVIFYRPELLLDVSPDFPFWGVLRINDGGMASHGGMLGMIAACWVFAAKRGLSRLHMFDLCAFVAAPGLCLGRLANFVNAELQGRLLSADMQADPPWWSIKYPVLTGADVPPNGDLLRITGDKLPDLAPAIEALGMSGADWLRVVERSQATGGNDLEAVAAMHGMQDQIILAAQEGNEAVIAAVSPLLLAYWPSQLFQAITDGPILLGLLAIVWLRPRKPGVLGCWFLMTYGVLRLISEQFREPDDGVALLLGLSRGQVLSLVMVVFGALALPVVARRPVDKLGGLLTPSPANRAAQVTSADQTS